MFRRQHKAKTARKRRPEGKLRANDNKTQLKETRERKANSKPAAN